MAGKIGSKTNLPYNASKAAVISMTKSLALAHARRRHPRELRVPGLRRDRHVDDGRARAGRADGACHAEEFTRQRASQVPLGRMERAEDVAHVIAFLASPRAGYMTGQALSVDGGLVMH